MRKLWIISITWLSAFTAFGAAWTDPNGHWAFAPIKIVQPPADPEGWSFNAVDRFIVSKLREKGLSPASLADKRTLIRRVSFDLTGLPPTPGEVASFANDTSPTAYSRLLDRLLASPRYGERWGRHWMDVVRYADTAGDNADYPIPEIRLYRDYIIDAFNADKPYDRFVQEQLAGDLLAKQSPAGNYGQSLVATGFIALSRRYATAPFELWHLTLEDSIETTGRAFMGLTLRCARCHDHKFDPVTKEDYYALYGIFASTQYPYAGSEEFQSKSAPRTGFLPLSGSPDTHSQIQAYQESVLAMQNQIKRAESEDELAKQIGALKDRIDATQKRIQDSESQGRDAAEAKAELASLQKQREQSSKQLQDKLKPLRAALAKLQRPGAPRDLPVAYAVCDGNPADARVQLRGDPGETGPPVRRGPPKILAGSEPFPIPEGASGRLQLAQWLTRAENPLTARVMVNRIWQHHFGKGIVGTPSNFGLRGDEPTHPELLDYLATQFIGSGWSIKALHRLILLSRTYQLASVDDAHNSARDPANRWCWKFDRRRLDAESIRDAMLLAAGRLDTRQPNEHAFPSIESWTFTQHTPFKAIYESNHRSVYLMTQRFQRHPYLALFDGPDSNTTTDVRTESTVAPQALFMMNSTFVREQAEALAKRLIAESGDAQSRIQRVYEWTWARSASETEVRKFMAFLDRYERELAQAGSPTQSREMETWTTCARILLSANEFVYID